MLVAVPTAEAQLPPLVAYSDDGSGVDLEYSAYAAPVWPSPGSTAVPGPFTGGGWPLHWKVAYTRPDGNQQVVVFLERDLSSRDRIWAAFWNGTTWQDGRGTAGSAEFLDRSLPTNHRQFDAAYEQLSGELLVTHGANTDEMVEVYLNDGTTWTLDGTNETFNNVAATFYLFDWIRLAPMPGTNRIAFIGVANGYSSIAPVTPLATAAIQAMVWDGDSNTWIAASKQLLSSPVAHTQTHLPTDAIDIDFVMNGANAGEAVAIWGNGRFVYANVWNPSTHWGSNVLVADLGAGNDVRWIRQKANPGSDDLVAAIGDSNERVHAVRFDGDSRTFGSLTLLESSLFGDADSNRPFDVVWSPRSGPDEVLVLYSDAAGVRSRSSTNGGVAWGPEQTLSTLYQTYWVQAELDAGNVIQLAAQDHTDALLAGTIGLTVPFTISPSMEADASHNVEPFALTAGPLRASGACCGLSVTDGAGILTVTAAGSFEMTFDEAHGGAVTEFYDLAEDPSRNHDLAGGTALEGLFSNGMVVNNPLAIGHANDSHTFGARLHLLEATETRVRVRQWSRYQEQSGSAIVPGMESVGDYSIYGSGKTATEWERRASAAVTTNNHGMGALVLRTTAGGPLDPPNWTLYSDAGVATPISPGNSDFSLAEIETPGARTDFLQIIHQDETGSIYMPIYQNDPLGWKGTSYYDDNGTTYAANTSQFWRFLTYFKPTNFVDHNDAAVLERRDDYRGPSMLAMSTGQPWIASSEHTAVSDDYNEAESAYVLTFEPVNGLVFDIDGSSTTRHTPFFKIRQWRSLQDPTVSLESVPLINGVDFKADVKPVSRAHFARDIRYHSTLHAFNDFAISPQVGDPTGSTVNGGTAFVTARYGNGARFTNDGDYLAISSAGNFNPGQGAIELWYQPSYDYGSSTDGSDNALFGYWIDSNNFFYAYHEPGNAAASGLAFQISTGGNFSRISLGGGASYPQRWRANDWVHLRFEWRAGTAGGEHIAVIVNGELATPALFSLDYPTPVATEPIFNVGDRARSDNYNNNAGGIIDELVIYDTAGAPRPLAMGGLTSDPGEFLASATANFTLGFGAVDARGRGEYLYFGSDSQFRGLNVALATPGQGTAPVLAWEYWNGTAWVALAIGGDGTNNLTSPAGTIYWSDDPSNWSVYSVNGGPELYYVRAYLASGDYATDFPVEGIIKTDILLFQYCGDITLAAQTFDLDVPAPLSVKLASFEATGLDRSVELRWETSSELNNLGFHVYRSGSEGGAYERVTMRPIPGLGSSPSGARYRYRDEGLENGVTYYYQLEDLETTGASKRHGPVSSTPSSAFSSPQPSEDAPEENASPSLVTYGEPSSNALRVVKRSARGVVLELSTEGFYAEPLDDGTVRLVVPGFDASPDGGPEIPVKRSWVEAVAGRKVKLVSVRPRQVETFSSLLPSNAEIAELVASPQGTVRAVRRRGRAAIRADGLIPSEAARIVSVGFQGDDKKALIELAPLRWDGASGQLLLARRLTVRLSFHEREPLENAFGGTHLSKGRRYRDTSRASSSVLARLHTTEPGLHALRYEDVMSRRRGVAAASLRLSRQGETVPFHLEESVFGPGSVLYFLGDGARANPYGHEAVYELSTDSSSGESMDTVSARPWGPTQSFYWHRQEWEQDRYYQSALVDAPDLWLWDVLFAPETKTFPLEVSALAQVAEEATLRVWLQGVSDFDADPDHHVRVYVNASFVGETSWNGKAPRSLELSLAPGLLDDGTNVLELENVGDTGAAYSMVMLDRYALDYPRRPAAHQAQLRGRFDHSATAELSGFTSGTHMLDVTDARPRWLDDTELGADGLLRFRAEAGRSYLAVGPDAVSRPLVRRADRTSLKSSRLRADYLVIGPDAFLKAAKPLLKLRRSQGLSVLAVSIDDVYSEFGFGETTPDAVKEFIAYAFHHWRQPSPRYVLLLGDASYDFKDMLNTGTVNHVPPLIVKTSYLWTASDPGYAAVNGDDLLPDLAIGRLPAQTVDQLHILVRKILDYETGEASISRAPVVLVADNPDHTGNFEADARNLASSVLASRDPRQIFLGQLGSVATRNAISRTFDDGASIVSYIGHGGIQLWADENVFHSSDVAALAPQTLQPLLLTMNCLNGFFHFPYFDSLAEALVQAGDKGAIAAISPSGLSLNGPAAIYHRALLQQLLHGGHQRLGDALLHAQKDYADTGAFPELLAIYHLLGDPALTLK
jgi:hypothetical protein